MQQEQLHLAMIPGINNTARLWGPVIEHLPRWVSAHALDCPPLNRVEEIADELLARLPEIFCLCGFSFGGYVALAMLDKAPERISSLILINTTMAADNEAQIAMRQQAIAKAESGGHEALVEAQAPKVFHPHSLIQEVIANARTAMVKEYGPERFIAHLNASIARPDRCDMVSQLDIPTLVLAAENDQVIPVQRQLAMANFIKKSTFTTIPESGHMMPLEKPAELANKLTEWLCAMRAG